MTFGMNKAALAMAAMALTMGTASTAEARACKRLTKTEGAVVGAVAGGVLGHVIAGRGNRTTGTVIGAGVGGVAGHEIARKKYNRNCYRRR
ncbi:glycine zipper 2TM domain-containing protein [Novosphingobium sp. MW5]|nr:glycine zipper 2TM domain-containing protein [Novosphingobium sp. MW5]